MCCVGAGLRRSDAGGQHQHHVSRGSLAENPEAAIIRSNRHWMELGITMLLPVKAAGRAIGSSSIHQMLYRPHQAIVVSPLWLQASRIVAGSRVDDRSLDGTSGVAVCLRLREWFGCVYIFVWGRGCARAGLILIKYREG